jgi:TRAP-type mannitol/chloroaromatic compound transport system permease small subunit
MKLLRDFLHLLDRLLSAIESVAICMVALVLIACMCLIATDALGRYLFNSPLVFTVDLVSRYLLPIIMLLPASRVLRRAGHISVDLFSAVMPVRAFQALIGLSLMATVPVIWVMTYRITHSSIESYVQGKVSFGLIPWPLWAEQAIYAFLLGLLTVRLVHVAATNLVAAISGETDIGISMLNVQAPALEKTS